MRTSATKRDIVTHVTRVTPCPVKDGFHPAFYRWINVGRCWIQASGCAGFLDRRCSRADHRATPGDQPLGRITSPLSHIDIAWQFDTSCRHRRHLPTWPIRSGRPRPHLRPLADHPCSRSCEATPGAKLTTSRQCRCPTHASCRVVSHTARAGGLDGLSQNPSRDQKSRARRRQSRCAAVVSLTCLPASQRPVSRAARSGRPRAHRRVSPDHPLSGALIRSTGGQNGDFGSAQLISPRD
jgi:hypothetical protein